MAAHQIPETMATYIIYRDLAPGQPFDPTSPLVFFPPKGSDELFDALRMAFPNVKTHSERMRDAIIQYLLEERQDEQTYQNTSPATTSMDTMPTQWPSMSSDTNSLLSSPELLNFGTPTTSFANSPQPQTAQLTRQASIATSADASPPTLDAMTGVFSVSTSEQPKQRMRRKMTEAEKVEYRKRRIVKACDKCAKRKRKCPHNQAQMETIPVLKSSTRISKSTSPKSSKSATPSSVQQETFIDPALMPMDDLAFLDKLDPLTMAPIEDFNMFDDPFSMIDLNQFEFENAGAPANLFTPDCSPTQQGWLHDPTFNLQPLLSDQSRSSDNHRARPSTANNLQNQHFPLAVDIPQLTRLGTSLDSSASSDAQSSWEGYDLGSSSLADGGQHNASSGNGLLWQHFRAGPTEKPVPTHTVHVHNAGLSGQSSLSRPTADIQPLEMLQTTSLPQTVLRITGTRKALKSFAGLLTARSSAFSPMISLQSVANVLRSNSSGRHANIDVTTDGPSRTRPSISEIAEQSTHSLPTSSPRDTRFGGLPSNSKQVVIKNNSDPAKTIESGQDTLGPLQRSKKLSTSTSSTGSRSSQPSRSSRSAHSSLPASVESQNARFQVPPDQPRPPKPTLGEGIPETANPALQLYMSRRRANMTLSVLGGTNTCAGTVNGTTTYAGPISIRATNAVRLETRTDRGLPTPQKTTSSANGGAYPRLEEANANSLVSRARQPTFSDFAGITSALHKQDGDNSDIRTEPNASPLQVPQSAIAAATSSAAFASRALRPTDSPLQDEEERPSYHMLLCDHHGRSSSATENPQFLHGTDTHREKDHFGRTALVAFFFACLVWLAAQFGSAIAPSMFCLVILQHAKEQEKIVQCSGKNSWWLSSASKEKRFGSIWQDKMLGRDGDRFVGLMHPHGFSPLRFGSGVLC